MRRAVVAYDKGGDAPTSEAPLVGVELAFLRGLVGAGAADPELFDSYPLGLSELAALRPFCDRDLDPGGFDYFLECFAA